jgi:sulfate permease, SulP family
MAMAIGSPGVTPNRPRLRLFASFSGYKPTFIVPDLVAGVTLAAIAIPEQMATARLGSLSPQIGFFAFIAASLTFLVFGASRQMSAGADSTITPIFAGALALLATAGSPHYATLAAGLAVMVGIIVGGAGLLRMGWIGNLLSMPVTTGFLAGIAVHIMVSQLPAAMGVAAPAGNTLQRLIGLIALAPHANPAPLAIAGGVLVLITLAHLWSPRIPGPLIAVVLAGGAVAAFHLDRHGVSLLGSVAGGLPQVSFPMPAFADFRALVPLAFLVSLVVMVQTAATARSFPPPGEAPDENGDYVGMGLANIAAGLLGAFPVDASPPRTAIVAESGGRSQLASLTAVGVIVALLLVGTHILSLIPEAALAGVLLFVALRIVRVGDMRAVLMASPVEAVLIAVTALAIVTLPIESGVALGVALSMLSGVWSSARTRVKPMRQVPGTTVWWPAAPGAPAEAPTPGVAVLTFQAPMTFLSADAIRSDLLAAIRPGEGDVRLAVLEAAGVVDIDFTAAGALKDVVRACQNAGIVFAVARLESVAAQAAFTHLGLRQLIGPDHIFDSVAQAVEACRPVEGKDLPPAGAGG